MTYTDKLKLKKKTFKRKCKNFKIPEKTCYTKKNLIDFAKHWNNKNKNKKITHVCSKTKEQLWDDLKDTFNTEKEDLWLEFIDKPFLEPHTFSPKVPEIWKENKNTWLSNIDISRAMHYYEEKYPMFHFIEPAPIDFYKKNKYNQCLHSPLCNYNYKSLYKKYDYLGVIFNTDPHNKSGQHWIALFIHLKLGEISFFDSTGNSPPIEIQNLINEFKTQGQEVLQKKIKINYNKTPHQQLYTECGIYCLAFMHHMLITDGDFTIFNQERLADEKIQFLRAFFFDDVDGIYPYFYKDKNYIL